MVASMLSLKKGKKRCNMSDRHKIITADFPKLLLAGNALLTFQSNKTGNHLTFHIVESTEPNWYTVRHKGKVIGAINFDKLQFEIKPPAPALNPVQEAFAWIWKHSIWPETLDRHLTIYNHGKCVRCGRDLTTPESITLSLGPECVKLIK